MTAGSKVSAQIQLEHVPILAEARQFAGMDIIPGGTLNNLNFVKPYVHFDEDISRIDQVLLADAQTSGGLLVSLPENDADTLVSLLEEKGVLAAKIGRMSQPGEGLIIIKKQNNL
jgi:selenide,water dikinase